MKWLTRITASAVAGLLFACAPIPESAAPAPGSEFGAITREAALAFLGSLPDSTRPVATLPFDQDERRRWFFVPTSLVPGGRHGLPLERMTPAQRDAAWRLLETALSPNGFVTARAIAENESLLHRIENENPPSGQRLIRDPLHYWVSIFGTPGDEEPWGWRFEGHHLSVNVTRGGPDGTSVTPLFMGANPHRVPSGPTAGARLLAREEDVARELLALFDPAQRARAIAGDTTHREILTRNDPVARQLPTQGLPAAEMTAPQRAKLRELLEVYAHRLTPTHARQQLARIDEVGFERLYFVWSGSTDIGRAHYYRIHGPTVLVEYDNSQNNANHSHTVWRDLENDFGGDLLRRHYERHRH
jgi:hypothetical protein